jgi:hypothetical protein
VVTAIATLLSESGTSVMAFFLGALVLAVAALSLKAVRFLTVAAWIIAVLFAVPLGALPYRRIGRGCRRRALPPASISGSTSPTTSIKGRSQASAFRGPRDLHFKIPTDADAASHAAYALKGRDKPTAAPTANSAPVPGAHAARLAHSRIGVSSGRSNGLDGARRGKSSFTCHNSLID